MYKYILATILLLFTPRITSIFYDADIVWHVETISTKLIVILLLVYLITKAKKKALSTIALVVVCYITINQFVDMLPEDVKPTFHFVSESENE